jgi:hypothetical protein
MFTACADVAHTDEITMRKKEITSWREVEGIGGWWGVISSALRTRLDQF